MAARRLVVLPLLLGAALLAGCGDAFAPPEVDKAAVAAATREIAATPAPRAVPRSAAEDVAMLRRVAARTAAAAQPFCEQELGRRCDFALQLVPGREANAFAFGRDRIAVTAGLMRLVANEDELAAVVAHEMAHHIAGHIPEGSWRAQAGALLGAAVGSAVAGMTGLDVAEHGAQAGAKVATLTFSKAQEREADYLAAFIAARAGFDLARAGGIWAKLTHLSGDVATSLLDSHPAGPERLAIWRRSAAEIAADPRALPRRG